MSAGRNWDKAERERQERRPVEALPVLGSRERVGFCKHRWDEWYPPEGTYGTIEHRCLLCGKTERGKLVMSQVAQTEAERNRIRGQARFRKGFALSPRGQQNVLDKQRPSDNEGRTPGHGNRTV